MNLLDLMVTIGVDDQATQKVGEIAEGVKSGLGTAAAVGGAAVAAMGAATAAAGAAFVGAAGDVAAYGDNIDKMSQKMGMSATAYQEWDAVMQHSGTSMETMKASMKTLANAAETGSDAFDKLGISQEQIASMSQEQLFEATISALQNVEDETTRTYLAGQTLGRGATELGALLNTSAEDTQAMRDRVHELGGVMADDAVKAAAAYQDSLQDMQTAFGGLKNNMMAEFLPALTGVMDGLQEVFSGNYGDGLDKIQEGIDGVVANIAEVLPRVTEVGGGIISALVTAFSENLPSLIEAMVSVVSAIAEAVIENMPTIVAAVVESIPLLLEAAAELFAALVEAVVESVPVLLDSVQEALGEVFGLLGGNTDGMTEAAVELFGSIGAAMGEALPSIIEFVGEAVGALASFVVENAPAMLSAAGQFFGVILDAVVESLPAIVDGLANGLLALVDMVVQNGPQMLAAAGEFVLTLLAAIVENLPGILGALVQGIGTLVAGVAERLPDMLAAGVELLGGLLQAIGQALPDVLAGIGELVTGAVAKIPEFVGDMVQAGIDLIGGLVQGILDNPTIILDTILGMAQGAVDGFLSFFGIASPSKLMREFGEYTIEGFAQGIERTAKQAEDAMRLAAGRVYGAASGTIDLGLDYSGLRGMQAAGVVNNYYVDGVSYLPGTAVAEAVAVVFDSAVEEARR